jgi:predicted permease
MNGPPRLALWLFERSLAAHERDLVTGDVIEDFALRAAQSPRRARRWFWRQTVRSVLPNLRRRFARRPHVEPSKGPSMLNRLAGDFRFGLRLMARQPLMTSVGLVSLTAGLGLNVLLFTIANAILLRPLPLGDPDRLVVLLMQRPDGFAHNFSYPDYEDLRDGAATLDGLVAYSLAQATTAGEAGATAIAGELASGNFFEALGVPVRLGRGLTAEDDDPAAPPAAVVSHGLWRERYGDRPLGTQTITLNGSAFSIVGVADDRFLGMQLGRAARFWIPHAHGAALAGGRFLDRRTVSWLTLVGRIRPGVSVTQARDELDAIARRVFETTGRTHQPIVMRPGARGDSALPERLRSPLTVLQLAGGLVLLVACLNVANLQLARTEARRRELAVRAALGARRFDLVRLLVVDGALLAIGAGLAALGIASLGKARAAALISIFGEPIALAVPIDGRVVGFTIAATLASALLVGFVSAWSTARRQPAAGLADGRGDAPPRRVAQRALVVLQCALSMALLTGASLLARTLDNLRSTDLGFETRRVALVEVSPAMGNVAREARMAYFEEATRRVAALPGVERAAAAHVMPLDFGGSRTTIDVDGYRPGPDEDLELNFLRVTPGYFQTLGIPILRGRAFDDHDRADAPTRIIVNETMAERYWRDGRAVGRFVRFTDEGAFDVEVVGVVPDVHYRMVREEPRPSFYVPMAQMPAAQGVLHVRFGSEPDGRLDELRRVIAEVNPAVPVMRTVTLRQQIERNIADERMAGTIGVALAGTALVLAAAGLYATMAFLVGRRTREIGVRVALGATARDVGSMVLRQGLGLVALGVAAGLALALWAGHALRAQLYGVSRTDPISMASAAALLALTAVAASWIPSRRATRVDPAQALRDI